jgi:hypothetical protein
VSFLKEWGIKMIECNSGTFGIFFGFIYTLIVSLVFFRFQTEKNRIAILIFLLISIAVFFTICCLFLPNIVCQFLPQNEENISTEQIALYQTLTKKPDEFQINVDLSTLVPYNTETPTLQSTNVPIIAPTAVKEIVFPTDASNDQSSAGLLTSTPVKIVQNAYPHNSVSLGSGIFNSALTSDGMQSYTNTFLSTYHSKITFLSGNPEGCGRATYSSNYIWIGGLSGTTLTLNGVELGTLSQNTGSHGVLLKYSVNVNDDLCALNVSSHMYHIVVGPDILYHFDSYCYRGNCS